MGWIAVDLDGTLAEWGTAASPMDILRVGRPIPAMVARVQAWIAEGQDVRIFTARVGPATEADCREALAGLTVHTLVDWCGEAVLELPVAQIWDQFQRALIDQWCIAHLGRALPITATKDFHMIALWDDRCEQVITNTGQTVTEYFHSLALVKHAPTD